MDLKKVCYPYLFFPVKRLYLTLKKSRIRETKHLLTDAESSTAGKKLLGIFFIPPHCHGCRRRQGAFTPFFCPGGCERTTVV